MRFEPNELEEEKRKKVLSEFYAAVTMIENYEEAKQFFKDLLTTKETLMLARRLQIATMLIYESSYQDIQNTLKVGLSTIASVQNWLNAGGKGYRTVIERLKEVELRRIARMNESKDPFNNENLKRKYASYYWPEEMVEFLSEKISKKLKYTKKKQSIND